MAKTKGGGGMTSFMNQSGGDVSSFFKLTLGVGGIRGRGHMVIGNYLINHFDILPRGVFF